MQLQLIWAALLAACALARPNGNMESVDTVDTILTNEKMEASRKVRFLQTELEAVRDMEEIAGEALIRRRRSYELHDWLTESQKQTIRNMESSNAPAVDIKAKLLEFFNALPADLKEKWNDKYKKQCTEWVEHVTSEEELKELKQLAEHKNFATLFEKLDLYKARLNSDQLARVELWKDTCRKLWAVDSQQNTARRLRRELSHYKEYLHWVTKSQIKTLQDMKADGATPEQIQMKVKEYFNELPADVQTNLKKEIKEKCIHEVAQWIKEVANYEQLQELRRLDENGDYAAIRAKTKEYFKKLPEARQAEVGRLTALCRETWIIEITLERRRREIDNEYKEWIAWMTDEQKAEVDNMRNAGSTFEEIHKKVKTYFDSLDAEKKGKLLKEYKEKCESYFSAMSTEEELQRMSSLHNAGEHAEVREIIDAVIDRQPEEKKRKAKKFQKICDEVYNKAQSRRRRDIDALMNKHLSWLTDEQKDEIRRMKASGDSVEAIKLKLISFIKGMDEENKKAAFKSIKESLKESCYAWMKEVTTQEERDELERIHNTDHDACKAKVREYILRLPAEKQATVNKDLPMCERIWYGNHSHSGHHHGDHHHHHHHHHRRRHISTEHVKDYIGWLTSSQREHIQQMEANGNSFDEIKKEIYRLFKELPEDRQKQLKAEFKTKCTAWVKDVANEEELAELKRLYEEENFEKLKTRLHSFYEELPEEKRHEVDHIKDMCAKAWLIKTETRRRRQLIEEPEPEEADDGWMDKRRRRELTEAEKFERHAEKYFTWLNEDQLAEVKRLYVDEGNKEGSRDKVMEFYEAAEGENKKTATQQLKKACRETLEVVIGKSKATELRTLKENGASKEEITAKVEEMISSIEDEEKKNIAKRYKDVCKKIFDMSSRRRREHTMEDYFTTDLNWLDDEQKEALKGMTAEGKSRDEMQMKIMEYFDALTGEKKKEVTELLKGGCRQWLKTIINEEQAAELKAMKESGADTKTLSEKIEEMFAVITDEDKKQAIEDFGPTCRRVYGASSRRKRHGEHHTLQEYLNTHLKWLTDVQKEELKNMKKEGKSREDMTKKIMEYYESTEGDTKKEATRNLQAGCRELLKHIFGEEKAKELKTLRETGATPSQIEEKVSEMIEAITDEDHKKEAKIYGPGCKKVFSVESPRTARSHHHPHKTLRDPLQHYFNTHLKWLTEEQKDELRQMKESGKTRVDMQEKIMQWYDATTGETRERATEMMKGGCRELIRNLIGEDQANEIKRMKESGTPDAEISKKIEEMIEGITDEKDKKLAKFYNPYCKKIFGVARRRRDHHHGHTLRNTLQHYFDTHLKWLTEHQKDELRQMKNEGKSRDDMLKKVMHWYDETTGEAKEQATEMLKGGCRELIKTVVGEEKANEIKAMKDAGSSDTEIAKKIEEMIEAISDEEKKSVAKLYGSSCKKVFGVATRRRRDHHTEQEKFEEYLSKYLNWLSDEHKEVIRKMNNEGKPRGDIANKVIEYYEGLEADAKPAALEHMKGGCRHFLKEVIGEESAAELKALKDSGATVADIKAKVEEFLSKVTDEKKKEKIKMYGPSCKKVFGLSTSRFKRDHHHDKLEHYLKTHLKWLSDEQKEELKQMKAGGKSKTEMQHKVMEHYEALSGEAKEKAKESLIGGCRELLKEILGEEKATELKTMRDSGTPMDDLKKKVEELLAAVTDEHKKELIKDYGPACKKLFSAKASRLRRDHHEDHHEENLEHYLNTHLQWLSDAQKEELKQMKASSKSKSEMQKKVMEYYEALTGESKEKAKEHLKGGCRELIRMVLGPEKASELKTMKDSGSSPEEVRAKVEEMLEAVTDEKKKELIKNYGPVCKKLFELDSARPKRAHQGIDYYFKTYLNWLNEEQRNELKHLHEQGKARGELRTKILEYFDKTGGETREKAIEALRGGCYDVLVSVVGKQKADDIKDMKASGITNAEIEAKIMELFKEVTDEKKKARIEDFRPLCKKVYSEDVRRRRDDKHTLEHYFTTHLKWLSEQQKNELREMKAAGKSRDEIQRKVFEFYRTVDGETKEEATQSLQAGCRIMIKETAGEQKAEELKAMRESGASSEDLEKKIDEIIAGLTDEKKKARATEFAKPCKKLFGIGASRVRRHGYHFLDGIFAIFGIF